MLRIALIFFLLTAVTFADGPIILKGPAPSKLLYLKGNFPLTENIPLNRGPHGLIQYCYKADAYIVIDRNPLGEGYSISSSNSDNLSCVEHNGSKLKTENALGIYVGMPKQIVLNKLDIKTKKDLATIIWESTTNIDGEIYDVQTYLKLSFVNKRLDRLSVFTTTTNQLASYNNTTGADGVKIAALGNGRANLKLIQAAAHRKRSMCPPTNRRLAENTDIQL